MRGHDRLQALSGEVFVRYVSFRNAANMKRRNFNSQSPSRIVYSGSCPTFQIEGFCACSPRQAVASVFGQKRFRGRNDPVLGIDHHGGTKVAPSLKLAPRQSRSRLVHQFLSKHPNPSQIKRPLRQPKKKEKSNSPNYPLSHSSYSRVNL